MKQESFKSYRDGARDLIRTSEKAETFTDEFVSTIEYLSESFLYIRSLIELKKGNQDLN